MAAQNGPALAGPPRSEKAGQIRELIDRRPGGTITRHWLAILHVARLRAA
jgi:hypothetical protein